MQKLKTAAVSRRTEKELLTVIIKAGEYARKEFEVFDRKAVKLKSKREIVTRIDINSEKIIMSGLKRAFPEAGFISEEAGSVKARRDDVWIIDPIDGTTNFSIHNPLWAISIGLASKGSLVLGAIYAPVIGELYWAKKGKGAWQIRIRPGKAGKKQRIRVSDMPNEKILNTFCHGGTMDDLKVALKYYRHQKLNGFDCRQLGSAALELAYVAAGRVESIMIPGANSYDVAAGALLVKEAGGRVTDFGNRPWKLSSRDILASNGKVHKDLLKAINSKA